ncbi:MAG: Rieske (2Fe-2S) protein [Sporichthyaceae bacterium]
MTAPLTRRTVLRGSGVVGLGAVAGFALARRSQAASGTGPSGAAANGYGPAAGGGERLASLADVPDGGGLVLGGQHVVLVRSGDAVHAFSATCTHQGCTVDGVANGRITCPCHGSAFDATTGAVVQGPAPTGLPTVEVTVADGVVTLGGA